MRLLIVEDNPDNMDLLVELLCDHYELVQAFDGTEALLLLQAEPVDLVLLDISLPGIDGIDVLREIRKHPALTTLPVIAVTAHAMIGDRERFLATGFNGYLAKPIVDDDELIAAIEALRPAKES